jgi:RNA polymerase sigma-70 factor (ECF subfamily)
LAAYISNKHAIGRFLSARVGDRQEAEDILQELYLKLVGIEAPDDLRDPLAYLYRIALNLARDRRREQQRARKREANWVDSRVTVLGSEAVADAPSAETGLAAKQRMAAVRAALDELSPQCRRAFVLHKLEGLSHHEVAQRTGITRSTVEKHMRTALKHLITRLGRD